jgi:hypothetical protein
MVIRKTNRVPEGEYAVSYRSREEEGVFGIGHCDGEQDCVELRVQGVVPGSPCLMITEVYVNGTAESRVSMRVDQLPMPSYQGRGSYFFG